MNTDIKALAKAVKAAGRRGDSELLHITRKELAALAATGLLTANPITGLPEAYNLSGDLSGEGVGAEPSGFADTFWRGELGAIEKARTGAPYEGFGIPGVPLTNIPSYQDWSKANPNRDSDPASSYAGQFVNYPAREKSGLEQVFRAAPLILSAGFGGYAGLPGAAGAGGGMAAADAAGLAQMGQAAGLSGSALDAFVASGGTLGSTAAGAGAGAAAGGSMASSDAAGLAQMARDAGLTGPAAEQFVASGGTMGSTAAGGGGVGTGAGLPTGGGTINGQPLSRAAMQQIMTPGAQPPAAPTAPQGAPAPAAPSAPTAPGAAPPAPAGGSGPAVPPGPTGNSVVDGIIDQFKKNALGIGINAALMGVSAATDRGPDAQTRALQDQALQAGALGNQLLARAAAGEITPAQRAQLEQFKDQAKAQVRNHFASIGQFDSTARIQAEQQIDQQALAMENPFLQQAIQTGMTSAGLSRDLAGAAYTLSQQDSGLQRALNDFMRSVGQMMGGQAGKQPQQAPQQPQPAPQPQKQAPSFERPVG